MPTGLDWRRWVREYPLLSIGIAAVTGYFVARLHGESLVEGVSTSAVGRVTENVQTLVDERIADTQR